MRFPMIPRRVSAPLLLAMALCALLAGCGGSSSVSGTPTPKASATATPREPAPAAGFSLFKSPDGVYALTYPSEWSSAAEDGAENGLTVTHGVSFISPDKLDNFQAQPLNQSVAAGDYGVFIQGFADALGASSFKPAKGDPIVTTTTTIGAHTWTELDGTMVLSGKAYTIKQFGTSLHGATFLVIALAPTASITQVFGDDFKPMLASITFFK